MNAVIPITLEYNGSKGLTPAWDCIGFLHIIILLLCYGCYTVKMTALPPFLPNEYLLTTHRKEGQKDWEVFAQAVREMMSQVTNKPMMDVPSRNKALYKDFMTGRTDRLEFEGHVFEEPPMRKKKKSSGKEGDKPNRVGKQQ